MYLLHHTEPRTDSKSDPFREAVDELILHAPPSKRGITIEREADLIELARSRRALFLLTSGGPLIAVDGKAVGSYEEGDLIGLEQYFSTEKITVKSDFAVVVDQYDLAAVEKVTHKQGPLLSYLLGRYIWVALRGYSAAISATGPDYPNVQSFQPGEVIVRQGEAGDQVFTLIDGRLEVLVDNVRVGEVHRDEVFGVLAALGKLPRTATVRAAEPSMVLAMPRDNLVDLIRRRPETIEKLIQDLARVIQDQNSQLIAGRKAVLP